MRIFVIGTGRCGTVTFSKACKHITNYTSGHETNTSGKAVDYFKYPDNHIEVDPRLSYFVPILREKFPEAMFVHLQRKEKDCIHSLSKRGSLMNYGTFHLGVAKHDIKQLADIYYHSTVKMLAAFMFVDTQVFENKFIHVWLHDIDKGFLRMCKMIKAEYNKEAFNELTKYYNKS